MALLAFASLACLVCLVASAGAAVDRQPVDFFGGTGSRGGQFGSAPGGISVNQSGAGVGNPGDVYVTDPGNHRIERFARDDHGTPADGSDDTYSFVSAWGAGVEPSSGAGYEVCTVADECGAGIASGVAGGLATPMGIAVDQDTGEVYVADQPNARVDVYAGDGTFLRAFGEDVVESGPGNAIPANEVQSVEVPGSVGAGGFALEFKGQATGGAAKVKLINTSKTVTGVITAEGTGDLAKNSTAVTGLSTTFGRFYVGQSLSGTGIPSETTVAAVSPTELTLSKPASASASASKFVSSGPAPLAAGQAISGPGIPSGATITEALPGKIKISAGATASGEVEVHAGLPFNISAVALQDVLEELKSIGAGNVTVSGGPGASTPFTVTFTGELGEAPQPLLLADSSGLSGGTVAVSRNTAGVAPYEICVPANGNTCKTGVPGSGPGQIGAIRPGFGKDMGIAVSQPDDNPASGTVFLADRGNARVNTYNLDGSSPGSIGSASVFNTPLEMPQHVAVDARGILYADNQGSGHQIERYDTENANGNGIGFLAPITEGVNEVQLVWISATSGTFNLTYEGETTTDIPAGASAESVREALLALPAIGEGEVTASGGNGTPYQIEFHTGAGTPDVGQITAGAGGVPLSGASVLGASIKEGHVARGSEPEVEGRQLVSVNASSGQFKLTAATGAGRGNVDVEAGSMTFVLDGVDRGSIHVGDTIVAGGVSPGTTVTAVNSNSLTLSQPGPGGSSNFSVFETTADIDWDAPASGPGSLQAALGALPGIGAANVSVTGGPGDSTGSSPYEVAFSGPAADVPKVGVAAGSTPLAGGSGVSASTLRNGKGGLIQGDSIRALAVEPDSDGAGPDADTLYVEGSAVQQFGPSNAPGLISPPDALDAIPVSGPQQSEVVAPTALAIDQASGRFYVGAFGGDGPGPGVYVFGTPGPGPIATLDSLSDQTATSITANATITPNGTPPLSYHLEYSADGSNWLSGPTTVLGTQTSPQSLQVPLEPLGGFSPDTTYHVRLSAKRPFFPEIVTAEKTFTTPPSPPLVETTGSPVRTTTTARLDGRVDPAGTATTYHFEYGTQGPCDSNPCTSTEERSMGSGEVFALVSQPVEGLEPNTTYHYRLVADNGNPGSPVFGGDMTVRTFADEGPLSHGHLPGPVGSDRAWEMVSEADTSGNPIGTTFAPGASAISDDGDRAVYGVAGGTPLSENGTVATRLFAERTPHGWETKPIYASREAATGSAWSDPGGPGDLSSMLVENDNEGKAGQFSVWRLSPSGPPTRLFGGDVAIRGSGEASGSLYSSNDGSRAIVALKGSQDPAHPAPGETHLYDISSGQPRMVDLLPDGSVPPCSIQMSNVGSDGMPARPDRETRWVTPDGSLAFFETGTCSVDLYVRDFTTETTRRISRPTLSGASCGSVHFVKSIPGFAYFYATGRLVEKDATVTGCGGSKVPGGDVYRYRLSDGSLECVTCVMPGEDTGVIYSGNADTIDRTIGIAEDGSRIYFTSRRRLLTGAPEEGGLYRLDTTTGDLAYVGAFGEVGDAGHSAMTPDGAVVVFESNSASLNVAGGQQNGGTTQVYRYDDRDRSLVCISCPADGASPRGEVEGKIGVKRPGPGANSGLVSADGDDIAFTTPTALVSADQNTGGPGQPALVGADVYEWRAGRLLLVSDGISKWPEGGGGPEASAITPSGRDIFFTEAAQLTPDALDGYKRLYDARIGGGFEFARPPKPCPLEVCQGTPKGAPEEQAPGTQYLQGAQGAPPATARCPKAKVRRKGRCVPKRQKHTRKPAQHKRAKHDRRASR